MIGEEEIVFYDIETDSVFAPYCNLKMVAYQLGIESEPILVDQGNIDTFRRLLADPEMMKVSYNGINFDDIVLWRHDFYVHPRNRHDMYLALKTIKPTFPSFSLKFVNWALTGDWHEPEAKLDAWLLKHGKDKGSMYTAPWNLLTEYCKHDVRQTVNVFLAMWEKLQEPLHWKPYNKLELAMGEPLHEMILLGQEYIDLRVIRQQIKEVEKEKEEWLQLADKLSDHKVPNAISSQQLANYLSPRLLAKFGKTPEGKISIRKFDLVNILNEEESGNDPSESVTTGTGTRKGYASRIVTESLLEGKTAFNKKGEKEIVILRCAYEARNTTKIIGYLRSYLRAGEYEWSKRRNGNSSERQNSLFRPVDFTGSIQKRRIRNGYHKSETTNGEIISIPKSYYLSAAKTRRFQSSSQFGINFQNQNKRSKVVQLVPEGWLGFWLDSTQIENVVHIWASEDEHREAAYRKDENWNEYVWLCNTILGGNRNREQLDKIQSEVNPAWSVYKQYKTIKLALNFGMGIVKFADTTGLELNVANEMFEEVHQACTAIRKLQRMVRNKIKEEGYIKDPFDHIYSGRVEQAYLIVSYLVQGCGTGSVPKAMTIANYELLHSLDNKEPNFLPCIYHPYRKLYQYGVLTGTTHDECAGRISLGLPTDLIIQWIKELLKNMEEKFSYLFRGIPLRAKLAISLSNAAAQQEIDHRKPGFEEELRKVIYEGKGKIANTAKY